MIPGQIPKYKMTTFVEPGSVIELVHNYPFNRDAKSLTITQDNMNIILRDLGFKNVAEMDEEDKTSKYLDKIAEGVNDNMIRLPTYFPQTPCMVETTGKVFAGDTKELPGKDMQARTVADQIRHAVLHRACLLNDGANRGALYDPRHPQIHNGDSVFRDRENPEVQNRLYRMVNVFVEGDAEQMQEVPVDLEQGRNWTADDDDE